MTAQEAEMALKEGLEVVIDLFGRKSQPPYIGMIKKALGNDYFWFEGKRGSENLSGKVTAKQIAFWQG